MNELQHRGLNDLYLTSKIPFCIVTETGSEVTAFPPDFGNLYLPDFYCQLIDMLKKCSHHDGVLLYYIGDLHYIAITDLLDGTYLVTAPVSCAYHNSNVLPSVFRPFFNIDSSRKLLHFLADIPARENFQLSRVAMLGKHIYTGINIDGIAVIYNVTQSQNDLEFSEDESHITNSENTKERKHFSIQHEQSIADAISSGNTDAFLKSYFRPVDGGIGRMSLNALRQMRYTFICYLTLFSKAAITGGLPVEYSLDLSDYYCQRMDSLNSIYEISQLIILAGKDYCKKVKEQNSKKNYRSSTRICCEYIREHIYENISMNALVDATAINRCTLTTYFKEDTGYTISEYINREKLNEANYLLYNTDMSLPQISNLLGYCSQSYFCQKYKSFFNMTPRDARKNK